MKGHISPLIAVLALCVLSSDHGHGAAPSFMPIGSRMNEWFVTNSDCSVTITVLKTNISGGLDRSGAHTNRISFSSYAGFDSYVRRTSLRIFNLMNISGQTTGVNLRVRTTYGTNQPGLVIDMHLQPTVDISTHSFSARPAAATVVVPVSGLAHAYAQFGGTPFVPLTTSSNSLILDSSFATNSGRARIMLTFDDGSTAIYMQNGEQIAHPSVSMPFIPPMPPIYPSEPYDPYDPYGPYEDWSWWDRRYEWYMTYGWYYSYAREPLRPGSYHLLVTGSPGADTAIEGTADFVVWTNLGTINWDSDLNTIVIPISTNDPAGFFNARSY